MHEGVKAHTQLAHHKRGNQCPLSNIHDLAGWHPCGCGQPFELNITKHCWACEWPWRSCFVCEGKLSQCNHCLHAMDVLIPQPTDWCMSHCLMHSLTGMLTHNSPMHAGRMAFSPSEHTLACNQTQTDAMLHTTKCIHQLVTYVPQATCRVGYTPPYLHSPSGKQSRLDATLSTTTYILCMQ